MRDARVRLLSAGNFLAENGAKSVPWEASEEEVTYTFEVAELDLSSLSVVLAVEYVDPQGLVTFANVLQISVGA
jgi:hypothetical protein